ncbi:MAG: outer membrane beta-barrel protein [Rhizobiaceae bacterium]
MSMFKKLSGAALIALSCATAQASDLRGSIDSSVSGGSDWSGFYLGGGIAYGDYSDVDERFAPITGAYVGTGGSFVSSGDDLALSLHVGYNLQFNDFVVGAEADYINMVSNFKVLPTFIPPDLTVNSLASARLRLGYSLGNFLPFITGGVAYATTNIRGLEGYGVVGGVGVDYKVNETFVLGAQYLTYNFKDFGGDPVEVDADIFNIRLSAKF